MLTKKCNIYMKTLKTIFIAICSVIVLGSCSDTENPGLSFSQQGLYFQWGGEPQTISYTTIDVTKVELNSATEGWSATVDQSAQTITVTPPSDPGTDDKRDTMRDADLKFMITAPSGTTSYYTLNAYIVGDSIIAITAAGQYANSYVLTSPKSAYLFDVTKNGAGQPLSGVAGAKVLWQSSYGLIEHFYYNEDDGVVTFYVDAKTEVDDEDTYIKENGEYVMVDGNVLIAAVDASDNILWSWHLWFSKEVNNPLKEYSTYANGVTFMNRNLGAYGNSNGATDNTNLILDSYGLYYQWGRKDPFVRPYYHDCAGGDDEYLYNGQNSAAYLEFAERSSETGTVAYTIAHPTTFITNAACVDDENGDGIGDWLSTPDSSLWSGTTKSLYDPCPYGWRVPAGSDFDVLSLPAEEDGMDINAARGRFGWMLTDGTNSYFYLGGGFRSYYDGIIHNMNYKTDVYPSQPEPWEGYYWTAGVTADGKQSTCMYFDLTTTRTINKFNLNYPSKRANAMQIRCVKVK